MSLQWILFSASLFIACSHATSDSVPADAGQDLADAQTLDGAVHDDSVVEIRNLHVGDELDFEVPTGALGILLTVESTDNTSSSGIESLTAPSGLAWIDQFRPRNESFYSGGFGVFAAQFPMASSMREPIEPGTWHVRLGRSYGSGDETLTLRVWTQRTDDGVFHGGALDIVVWLPEGLQIGSPLHEITADSAPADPDAAERVDAFYEAMTLFELDRGTVEFRTLSAEFLSIDGSRELYAAGSATSGEPRQVAQFVWADEVSDGEQLWGIASNLPGAATLSGTNYSIVVVDVTSIFPARGDGFTMAHELGHFLGLPHTTELGGGGDYFDDTPECEDVDHPFQCPDSHNIMFPVYWGASGGVNVTASDEQRRIVHGSPIYRAYPR